MKINKHHLTVFWIILIATIDVITRNNAQLYFDPGKTDWVIKGILGLTYKTNYGGLFGWGSNWRFFGVFDLMLGFLVLGLSSIYYSKLHQYLTLTLRVFFILFTASFLGAIPDRIFLGYARDWIDWFGPGVANIADYCAFASLFLLFIGLILHPEVTWRRFREYNSSSIKKQLGLHLFQKTKNDKDV